MWRRTLAAIFHRLLPKRPTRAAEFFDNRRSEAGGPGGRGKSSRIGGALRRIHETGVADFDSGAGEFIGDLREISSEAFLELGPVGFEAEESDANLARGIQKKKIWGF